MSKRTSSFPTPALQPRIERALTEGRTQQALELARQLAKQEPTPEHRALLRRVVLERARQQRREGKGRDAVITLESNLALAAEDPAWAAAAAEELARAGGIAAALRLLDHVTDPEQRNLLIACAADHALDQGAAGRALLPEDLRPDFDAVRQAFDLAAQGRDDDARAALEPIGLRSPFLEWKLLLRGLIAYWQKNDALAVENWQRLRSTRLPARLAAPFRLQIDPPFRAAQPADTQIALMKRADRLLGTPLVPALRGVQMALAQGEALPQAFQLAEGVVQLLRQEAPHLLPRLAACFFFAIVSEGAPKDVERYKRLFGAPPEDPNLDRLRALTCEHQGCGPEAIDYWRRFEAAVAKHPELWRLADSGDAQTRANRVRALVWERIGTQMLELHMAPDEFGDEPFDLDMPFDDEDDAEDDATSAAEIEASFRRSIELAPDRPEPYVALFHHYLDSEQPAQAEAIGRDLLERFPDRAGVRELLGDVQMDREEFPEALRFYEQALAEQPLERRLRHKVTWARSGVARILMKQGKLEEGRAAFAVVLAADDIPAFQILAQWSLSELVAGEPGRSKELLEQARARGATRLGIAYFTLTRVIQQKLPRTLKSQWDREFAAALAEPPVAQSVVETISLAAACRAHKRDYSGRQTHEKKLLAYLQRAIALDYSEEELAQIGASLAALEAFGPLEKLLRRAQAKYPQNPAFPLFRAHGFLLGTGRASKPWLAGQLLEQARELALALPPDEHQQGILKQIDTLAPECAGPLSRGFAGFESLDAFRAAFEEFLGGGDDDERRPRRRSR